MPRLRMGPAGAESNPLCGTDWGGLLGDEFALGYWGELMAFVQEERSSLPDPVYPPANEVFRALELTWCQETKVVIVGQDPYYVPGQAFRTRIEAERFTAGSEISKARGEWVDPALGRISLSDWASAWLDAVGPALKPKTVRSYDSLINSRITPAIGYFPIGDLAPMDVQRWVNAMRSDELSASRMRQAHVVISQVLASAVREGRIGRNVALGIKLPPIPRREAKYFEPDVVERIASSVREPYDLLVRLLGRLGPRFGEAAALRRRSVNLLTKRLTIEESIAEVSGRLVFGPTKTHAMRKLPLPPSVAADFKRHLEKGVGLEPDALVFTSPTGTPLRYRNFMRRVWRPTLEGLELPGVGVHVLRHSAAAALIQSGASATAVQKILGHRSAAFTLTVYGHIFDTDLDLVAENLDQAWGVGGGTLEPRRGPTRAEL